ncbi:hypothetical protein [Solirubrobacter soli]|uniref:hypothetical protein n=1 Tax=Solirubrobacter soli TaxID=363832 RepID=UPI0003F63A39|nr:hypothetical protein [Solirubrobacter soli]
MRRLLPLLVVPAVALVPSTALAHGKSKTKVYKGTFTLVGADGDYVTGNFGKVQLVDNKRNDKLSVHVRRVAAKTTYTYKLVAGVCKQGAAGGAEVPGFKYKPLKTNRKGVGNSTARSRTFTAKRGVTYSVTVSAGGEVVLCAQLRTKDWPKEHGKKDKPHGKSDKPHGKSEDKSKGKKDDDQGEDKGNQGKRDDAPGHAEDKQRGKSEDAPGQADDKQRGKSDDAPGHDKDKGKPRK